MKTESDDVSSSTTAARATLGKGGGGKDGGTSSSFLAPKNLGVGAIRHVNFKPKKTFIPGNR
uniref:Uncharacterized protein n=1 Tax=Romanomermis culicivorax TaxID=13658 RepID=A0A915I102_ROMCU